MIRTGTGCASPQYQVGRLLVADSPLAWLLGPQNWLLSSLDGLVAAFDLSLSSNLPFYNRLSALSPLEEVRQAATAGWERFNTGLPLAISLHCQ
jgi:hypothetical protein